MSSVVILEGLLYVQYDRQGLLDLASAHVSAARATATARAEPGSNAAKISFTEIAGDCSTMAAPSRG